MTVEPAGGRRGWPLLEPADLRGDAKPEIRVSVEALARAALRHDSGAIRKLAQLFRSMFFGKISDIASVADVWWQREELANDFLTFLLTGVRPNLRERGNLQAPLERGIGDNSTGLAPLENWLGGDNESLWAFVAEALSNLCIDLVRRGQVQDRRGHTGDPRSVERRTDADVAAVPTPGRTGPGAPEAERRLIEADEVRLYRLALESLSERERVVITGIHEGLSQVEIADRLGIGKSRISQLKKAAIAKLRAAIAHLGLNPKGNRK